MLLFFLLLSAVIAQQKAALEREETRRVVAFQAEEERRYAGEMGALYCVTLKTALAYFPYSALTYTFLPYCTSCLVLYYGGKLVHEGKLQGGELVSFVFYMQSLFDSFSSLGDIYTALATAIGAADKVIKWIQRKPTLPLPAHPLSPSACRGEVPLDAFTFLVTCSL